MLIACAAFKIIVAFCEILGGSGLRGWFIYDYEPCSSGTKTSPA
tara:strand:- start:734 stop:865 length:132 start_codon:yes stop_codon:yes gene_type:complete